MKAKEFIRIRLDADARAVLAWLRDTAVRAGDASHQRFQVSELAAEAETEEADEAAAPSSTYFAAFPLWAAWSVKSRAGWRRYGLFARGRWSGGAGELALEARLLARGGATVVELRCGAAFPLSAQELMEDLQASFSTSAGEIQAVALSSDRGAPLLACNVWLEEELHRLPNRKEFDHLYAPWLKRYVELCGYPPAEPRRSFRSAVRSRLQHIERPPRKRRG